MTFFYNLNNKLNAIRDLPSVTHGQLNERDMSRAAKGYEKYGKQGMEALAKAGRDGKALDPVRKKYDKYDESMEEGMGDMARKVGGMVKKVAGKALDTVGHGSDADMIRDLQKKMGVAQTGMKPGAEPNPKQVKEKMSPAKAKSFAALAEPKDKITFADKIAGAKKEVDEMLGDVAAEAMKQALGGGKGRNAAMGEEEDLNPFTNYKKPRADKPKVGSVERGALHDIEHTATGRKVTRRVDPAGISVGADDDKPADGEKRGRGRPKGPAKTPERVTGGATKHKGGRKMTKEAGGMKQTFAILDDTLIDQIAAMNGAEVDPDAGSVETYDENTARQLIAFAQKNPQRLKRTQTMNTAGMKPMAQRVGGTSSGPEYDLKEEGAGPDDIAVLERLMDEAFAEGNNALGNAIQGVLEKMDGGEKQVDEKATSKKQQKFMGMVHAAQKGEKPASKEVAKTAKGMGKKDAEDFAATKHKGLPEKKKPEGKKEKTEETADSTPSKGGVKYGGGIYDSMNRELENMIAESMARLDESMSINMSMNNDQHGGPSKSLTVTATDDDAMKLSQLLKSAGLGGGDSEGYGGGGYKSACGNDELDEVSMNQPDYPTETETSADPFQYSGGLNKPKATGQTTVPVIASQDDRQGMAEGYYDLDDEGMQPIDLSTNPPFKQLVNRYTQLFYQGHEGSYDEEESAESDAIEQYVAKRFGQKGSDHLLKAAQANYGGRDDGRGMGGSRGSNLGQPSQPSGDFRTTKAGKMHGQDAKMMKARVADRLGRHPEPNLPEQSYAEAEEDALHRMMEMAGISAPGGASAGDYIDYVSASGEQPPEDLIMQNGVEYDPDTNVISVRNATSLANTHRAIAAAGWKKQAAGARPNPAAAGQAMQAGDTAYQLGEQDAIDRMMEMAGVKKKEVDEEKTEEGNKFTGNLAKARADGKKEADLDGDGDMEKVRESIFDLTNQWRAYKG